MADTYIDKNEAVLYGEFAAKQIRAMLVGLSGTFDPILEHLATRIDSSVAALRVALKATGELELTTYVAAAEGADPVGVARDTLRKLLSYADSREAGEAIANDILQGRTMTTVLLRRPVKLAAALGDALDAVEKHKAALPEAENWKTRLQTSRDALEILNASVRKTRSAKREMTPAVSAARDEFLNTYAAAKGVVDGLLRLVDKQRLMHEVFDDLAEVHRVAGVADEVPLAAEAAPVAVTP